MSLPILLPLLLLLLLATSTLTAAAAAADPVEAWLEQNQNPNLQRRIDFISIPSVSSDPTRAHEVRRAATWLTNDLSEIGLENIQLLETALHPSIYADWLHAANPSAPTVLLYGHFDVQPEDPVDLWTTPPFAPTVRDGKLFARGASDDKGNLYVALVALRALLNVTGELPVNVKVLLEGEEEVGSPNLEAILVENRELLRADFAFSADGGQISTEIPGLCVGLRGSMAVEVKIKVADTDMHSGAFGGGLQNPNLALAKILASLHAADGSGRIAVQGFYEEVDEVSEEDREDVEVFPEGVGEVLAGVGANVSVGEEGYGFRERVWMRPAIDVVGMWGGFTGDGIKTVLPREAHAKISMRLVASQKKEKSLEQLIEHLEREGEKMDGISMEIETLAFKADAYKMGKRTRGNVVARKVLKELYGREPVFFRMGGSIPVMGYLQKHLGLETTMFAFGHGDENVHAPDEFARLESFLVGEKGYVRLLRELSSEGAKSEL